MKKKKWELIFKGKVEDFDPSDSLKYWATRSDEEKFQEVESLITQAQLIKGKDRSHESGLLRSTAVIKRQ